jgi:hypothetical protein
MTSPRRNPTASGIITLDANPEALLARDARSSRAEPDPYSPPRRRGPGLRRPVQAPLWACIAVLVVGSLVVAWGTHLWDASQVRRFQAGSVSVLLTVPGSSSFRSSGDGAAATLTGDLQVVNTGPRLIEVGQISSSTPGVTVSREGSALIIPNGTARGMDLSLKVDCAVWSPTEPLLFLLVVQTADAARRGFVAALALDDTPWGNSLQTACTAP